MDQMYRGFHSLTFDCLRRCFTGVGADRQRHCSGLSHRSDRGSRAERRRDPDADGHLRRSTHQDQCSRSFRLSRIAYRNVEDHRHVGRHGDLGRPNRAASGAGCRGERLIASGRRFHAGDRGRRHYDDRHVDSHDQRTAGSLAHRAVPGERRDGTRRVDGSSPRAYGLRNTALEAGRCCTGKPMKRMKTTAWPRRPSTAEHFHHTAIPD